MPTINFDLNFLCKTTGWQSNCGLNCLTHFFYHLLRTDFLQNVLADDPEYQSLLQTFQEYYELPKVPTWQEIKRLLDLYPVDSDKEGILSPVLRLHLGKKLSEIPDVTWDTDAAAAISDYITTEEVKDIALPIYHSNQAWFKFLKSQYEERSQDINKENISEEEANHVLKQYQNAKKKVPTDAEILEQTFFNRKNELLESIIREARPYWLAMGGGNYGRFMGNIANGELVSAEQLSLLTQSLSIGLEVYTPASIQDALKRPAVGDITHGAQNLPGKDYPLTFKVYNYGAHWEYEEPARDLHRVQQHNQYYPTNFTAAFAKNAKLSGQFKLYGVNTSNDVAEKMWTAVRAHFAPGPAAAAAPVGDFPAALAFSPAIAKKTAVAVVAKSVAPVAKSVAPVIKPVVPVAKPVVPVAKPVVPVTKPVAPVVKKPVVPVAKPVASSAAKPVAKPVASVSGSVADSTFNEAVVEQINKIVDDKQKELAAKHVLELPTLLHAEILSILNGSPQLAAQLLAQPDAFIKTFLKGSPAAQEIKLKNLPKVIIKGEAKPGIRH